ncbi:hypothetical protein N9198_04295, partial [Akkermansiaceae bacterium]|nr:hypothetical protein [Akkermansiaceae bacterium]
MKPWCPILLTLLGTVVLLQLELEKAPSPILLVFFTRKGDTKTFSSTHEEVELSSPFGLPISSMDPLIPAILSDLFDLRFGILGREPRERWRA